MIRWIDFRRSVAEPCPSILNDGVDHIQEWLRHKFSGGVVGPNQLPQTGLLVKMKFIILHRQIPADAVEEPFFLLCA